jgi:hypothetical protein
MTKRAGTVTTPTRGLEMQICVLASFNFLAETRLEKIKKYPTISFNIS